MGFELDGMYDLDIEDDDTEVQQVVIDMSKQTCRFMNGDRSIYLTYDRKMFPGELDQAIYSVLEKLMDFDIDLSSSGINIRRG